MFQLFVGGGDSSPVCRTGGVLRRTALIDNLAVELGVWGVRKRCGAREGVSLFPGNRDDNPGNPLTGVAWGYRTEIRTAVILHGENRVKCPRFEVPSFLHQKSPP